MCLEECGMSDEDQEHEEDSNEEEQKSWFLS